MSPPTGYSYEVLDQEDLTTILHSNINLDKQLLGLKHNRNARNRMEKEVSMGDSSQQRIWGLSEQVNDRTSKPSGGGLVTPEAIVQGSETTVSGA